MVNLILRESIALEVHAFSFILPSFYSVASVADLQDMQEVPLKVP